MENEGKRILVLRGGISGENGYGVLKKLGADGGNALLSGMELAAVQWSKDNLLP